MGRINHLLKFACIAAALTLLAASPALTARPPEPPAETVEMRLLPDRPIRVTGDGRVLELRAPAAGQLPSHGFDAELTPVYDTAEPVDIAQMPVRETPETPVPRACPFDGEAV